MTSPHAVGAPIDFLQTPIGRSTEQRALATSWRRAIIRADEELTDEMQRRTDMRWRHTGALALGVASTLTACSRDDARSAASSFADPTGPIFDDVEALTPASLPPDWERCWSGPSTLDGAGDGWWSQSFGPRVDGECQRSITITQVPHDDQFGDPSGEVIKVGDNDAAHWVDEDRGAEWLFLWAFQQNLVVEACCDESARAELNDVALQSIEGMRIDEPDRCRSEESDLAQEELETQLIGHDDRMYTDDGCPVRLDIVAMGTAPADDHCFPGVSSVSIGTPFGASKQDTPARSYTRDPDDLYGLPDLRRRLDLDAVLPADAIDTGYRRVKAALWIAPSDDSLIYVVTDTATEAWPLLREEVFCA